MSELSAKNALLVVVHPHNNECCAKTGKGTPETEAALDVIARVVPLFRAASIPVRFVFAAKVGDDPHKAYGGIHPKVAALIGPDDVTHQEHHAVAYMAESFRAEIKADVPRHHILVGFNLSDCLGKTAIRGRTDKELGIRSVSILTDASADRADIAHEELYADTGMGESMMSMTLRALDVDKTPSHRMLARLGL